MTAEQEILNSVKARFGLENDSSDKVILTMIEDAKTAVTLYCNRKTFPAPLSYIVRECVITAFQQDNSGEVASIKRGDTQINYVTTIHTDSFTLKQTAALNRYRKLKIR